MYRLLHIPTGLKSSHRFTEKSEATNKILVIDKYIRLGNYNVLVSKSIPNTFFDLRYSYKSYKVAESNTGLVITSREFMVIEVEDV